MTAVHSGAARARMRAPEPRPISWPMLGFAMALLLHLGAGVWFAADLSSRTKALEQELPPGAISRLDERTLQIQETLKHIEAHQ